MSQEEEGLPASNIQAAPVTQLPSSCPSHVMRRPRPASLTALAQKSSECNLPTAEAPGTSDGYSGGKSPAALQTPLSETSTAAPHSPSEQTDDGSQEDSPLNQDLHRRSMVPTPPLLVRQEEEAESTEFCGQAEAGRVPTPPLSMRPSLARAPSDAGAPSEVVSKLITKPSMSPSASPTTHFIRRPSGAHRAASCPAEAIVAADPGPVLDSSDPDFVPPPPQSPMQRSPFMKRPSINPGSSMLRRVAHQPAEAAGITSMTSDSVMQAAEAQVPPASSIPPSEVAPVRESEEPAMRKTSVETTFKLFCGKLPAMDARAFVKLCKRCCLLDQSFSAHDARLLFSATLPVTLELMDLRIFERALSRVAAKRGLSKAVVFRMVAWYERPGEGGQVVPVPASDVDPYARTFSGSSDSSYKLLHEARSESRSMSRSSSMPYVGRSQWQDGEMEDDADQNEEDDVASEASSSAVRTVLQSDSSCSTLGAPAAQVVQGSLAPRVPEGGNAKNSPVIDRGGMGCDLLGPAYMSASLPIQALLPNMYVGAF